MDYKIKRFKKIKIKCRPSIPWHIEKYKDHLPKTFVWKLHDRTSLSGFSI